MRKIKFRGQKKDGKWVYGYYLVLNNKHYIIDCCGVTSTAIALADSVTDFPGFHEVIPETIGQLVEVLEDKREVYENDILKDDTGEIGIVQFGKLPLDKRGDCVCTYHAYYLKCLGKLGQAPTFKCTEIGDWMIIIGNYTDNPELLE